MTDTTTNLTASAAASATQAEIRPPAFYNVRGGGLTFKPSGLLKEYYGAMRFLGYAASPISDIYFDRFKDQQKQDRIDAKGDPEKLAAIDAREPKYQKNDIGKIEAIIFAITTALFAWRDWKDMKRCFGSALGAEQQKSPSQVRSSDLFNTENPIVQTALKRFFYVNAVRFTADAAFGLSLNIGILGQAVRVTAERSLFSQKTAYDRLEKLFEDTQLYNFDVHSPGKIAKEFGNIVQQVQKDHDRQAWRSEVIISFNPLFEAMAQATADKKIGINDAVFLLGELMTKRMTVDESLGLLDSIKTHSLDGLRHQPRKVMIAKEAQPLVQAAIAKVIEKPEQEASKFAFSEKFLSHKTPLVQSQRSFQQMAEQVAEAPLRGA